MISQILNNLFTILTRPAIYFMLLISLVMGGAILPMQGCQSAPQAKIAVETAETSEQKAFARYAIFVIYKEQAAVMINDPDVPDGVKKTIQNIDRVASPIADAVKDLSNQVRETKALIAASREAGIEEGLSETEATLVSLTENMNTQLQLLLPYIDRFKGIVKR